MVLRSILSSYLSLNKLNSVHSSSLSAGEGGGGSGLSLLLNFPKGGA